MAAGILLLAGPTASGKTALALALAEAAGGLIVNADSMQVYADLAVLTARPTPQEEARAPHRLFGHVDASEPYSVGRWLKEAMAALHEAAGGPVVFVGGTGLYFKALTEGVADIPDPAPEARARARAFAASAPLAELIAEARVRDAPAVNALASPDRQRLARIIEVADGTARTLTQWRAQTKPPLAPGAWRALVLAPPKPVLDGRIEARVDAMLAGGALEEAARLVSRGLDPALPAMKALGVRALAAAAAGATSLADARARLIVDTRRYAKRQRTWFRGQAPGWPRLAAPDLEAARAIWMG